MTSYDKVYAAFSKRINDLKILDLTDQEVIEFVHGLMESAIPKFMMCKSDLFDRDDELGYFNSDLLPIEIEILATLMVSEWLSPQIETTELIAQFFGSKEEKYFAQANQINALRARQHEIEIKAPKLMNEYNIRSFVKEKMR